MRKILLLFSALFFSFMLFSQSSDSARYYQRQMDLLLTSAVDSVKVSDQYKWLEERYNQNTGKSPNFGGFAVFSSVAHSRYGQLNKDLEAAGLKALPDLSYGVGVGISLSNHRLMTDIAFANTLYENKSEVGNKSFKSSFSYYLQWEVGYDLVKARSINIYPYVGLSIRTSTLKYDSTIAINQTPDNITQLVISNRTFKDDITKLGWQAGLAIDILLSNKTDIIKAEYLTIKAGTTGVLGPGRFNILGYTYKPGIKQADWFVSIGIKFANFQ